MKRESRLVLGTAQLGTHYGIANRTGVPEPERAISIIEEAIHTGIREFDTDQAYGKSEAIPGTVLAEPGVIDQGTLVEIRETLNHDRFKKKLRGLPAAVVFQRFA